MSLCALVTIVELGTRAAGPALTRPAFSQAVQELGPVPIAPLGGGSFRPGKFSAADLLRTTRWEFGCRCRKPAGDFRTGRF